MRNTLFTIAILTSFGALSACDSDAERGIVGAAGGAAISKATGGDAGTGAILGGLAGVFCDDAGVCR